MFNSQPVRRSKNVPWWEYLKLKSGERWKGWLAGPVVGLETHWDNGTVGCRKIISNGALRCDYCSLGKERLWRGAVPLWGEAGDRWVVIVGETYAASLSELQHLDPVQVMKCQRRGSPLRVDKFPHALAMPRLEGADREQQDIKPWLLRLWKDSVLRDWLLDNPVKGEEVPKKASKPKPSMNPTPEKVGEAIARRLQDGSTLKPAKGQPGTLGEIIDQVLKPNGKGHK
jgi:hypothetical protein